MDWDRMSPLQKLLGSRKFLILMVDTIIALVGFGLTTWAGEPYVSQFATIWGILQAPVIFLITAIAYEDGKYMENNK